MFCFRGLKVMISSDHDQLLTLTGASGSRKFKNVTSGLDLKMFRTLTVYNRFRNIFEKKNIFTRNRTCVVKV